MSIFNKQFEYPTGFDGETLSVFPTNVEYAQSDFEAVMASKEELRLWSDSAWPADDFTLEENRVDLKVHVVDNEEHSAFGFMLYDPTKTQCYGSLYVNPINAESFQNNKTEYEKYDARIDCWIRSDLETSLKMTLAKEIVNWLNSDWNITWGLAARPSMPEYLLLLGQCGLKRALTLVHENQSELYLYTM